MNMDLFYDRRSVRSYTGEKISEEDIDKIVRAGFYAPTAVNKQETEFIII
ncbi:nitroreductase family protein [Entamoeba histolytica HM-1:IMSS-B]|nr:nitroreductase family protein [Entamoeba histolytica HM-1:IMSS-B]GAT91598.1 nitroreductase family protein [Entamoeba histolytica]